MGVGHVTSSLMGVPWVEGNPPLLSWLPMVSRLWMRWIERERLGRRVCKGLVVAVAGVAAGVVA